MEMWLWAGIIFLTLAVLALFLKVWLLRKSAREIREAFVDRMAADTNTLIDISSRDRIMRELAEAVNVQLRLLRRERQRFQQGDLELKCAVTNISHDLRTPLTAICGYLELLEQAESLETAKHYMQVIRNRTELLEQLTEELFRYSVIVTGEQKGRWEAVELNRVLEESVAAFYAAFCQHRIQPEIRIPEEKVIRMLDSSALTRIFSNLLQNAMKYSDGDLEITLLPTGEITFSNQASGLDQVQVGRLFDRFYTVEAARKSTGLGLSITRSLVEQMNGNISARYEEGRLSICICFPQG